MNLKTTYRIIIGALYVAIIFFSLPGNKTPIHTNVTALAASPSVSGESAASEVPTQNVLKEVSADSNTVTEKKSTSVVKKSGNSLKEYPYSLSIPSINIHAGIRAMGLEPDGKMAVPNNYTEVGWYSLGTKPGAVGNAVLGAHVDNGPALAGVFKNLKKVSVGDDIYVKDARGETLHYRVVERKIYDYRHKDTREVFGVTDKSRLNLITCHGSWISSENTYDQRLVVFAELVG